MHYLFIESLSVEELRQVPELHEISVTIYHAMEVFSVESVLYNTIIVV